MAIVSGLCRSYKLELLQGIHDFSADTIKAALYTAAADLSYRSTTAYSATNEATGTGWVAGGMTLPVSDDFPMLDPRNLDRAVVQFDEATLTHCTVTFRAVLLYNASKANRAIAVLDRGVDVVVTDGPITIFANSANPYLIFNA